MSLRLSHLPSQAIFAFLALVVCAVASAQPGEEIPSALPHRVLSLSASEADRLVYVETARGNLFRNKHDWVQILAIEAALNHYEHATKTGAPVNYEALRGMTNKAIAEYKKKAQALDDPTKADPSNAYAYMDIMASALSNSFSGTPGLNLVAATAEMGARSVVHFARERDIEARGNQSLLEMQGVLFLARERASSVLGRVHDLGRRDPKFGHTIDLTVGLHLGAYTSENALTLLQKNRSQTTAYRLEKSEETLEGVSESMAATFAILERAIAKDGSMRLDSEALEEQAQRILRGVQDSFARHTRALVESMDPVSRKLEASATREQLLARYKRTQEEIDASFRLGHSSLDLVCGVLSHLDSKAAGDIQVVGTASLKIARALGEFEAADSLSRQGGKALEGWFSPTLSKLNLISGILEGAGVLLSLLSGPSPDQQILDQLVRMEEQLATLEKAMHERFDAVDAALNHLMHETRVSFNKIHAALASVRGDGREAMHGIASLNEQMGRMNLQFYSYLREGFEQRIREKVARCTNAGPLGPSELEGCLQDFVTYATQHSTGALAAGSARGLFERLPKDSDPLRSGYSLLGAELDKGLWENVNFMGRFFHWRFGNSSLLHSAGGFANLDDWAGYSNEFMRFITAHLPALGNHHEGVSKAIQSIRQTGTQLKAGLAALATNRLPDGSSQASAVLDDYARLLDGYLRQLAVAAQRQQDLASPGIDPFAKMEDQPTAFQISFHTTNRGKMYPCPNSKTIYGLGKKTGPPLSLPPAVNGLFALQWQAAEKLGMGNMEICYRDLTWADKSDKYVIRIRHFNLSDLPKPMWELLTRTKTYHDRYLIKGTDLAKFSALAAKHRIAFPSRLIDPIEVLRFGKTRLFVDLVFVETSGARHVIETRELKRRSTSTRHHTTASITHHDTGAMQQRHGSDRSKWPSYNGYWVLWETKDLNGSMLLPDQKPKNGSLILTEVQNSWDTESGGLRKALLTAPAVKAPDSDPRTDQGTLEKQAALAQDATFRVQQRLSAMAAALNTELAEASAGAGHLGSQLQALTGAKQALTHTLRYSYPDALSTRDSLWSLLHGTHALPDRDTVLAQLRVKQQDRHHQPDSAWVVQGKKAVAEMAHELRALPEHGGQAPWDLHSTLARLRLLETSLEASRPKMSIDNALIQAKRAVHAYLSSAAE